MQLEKHAKLISDQFKTTEERTLSSMRFSTEIGGRGGGAVEEGGRNDPDLCVRGALKKVDRL